MVTVTGLADPGAVARGRRPSEIACVTRTACAIRANHVQFFNECFDFFDMANGLHLFNGAQKSSLVSSSNLGMIKEYLDRKSMTLMLCRIQIVQDYVPMTVIVIIRKGSKQNLISYWLASSLLPARRHRTDITYFMIVFNTRPTQTSKCV